MWNKISKEELFAQNVNLVFEGYLQAVDFTECGPDNPDCHMFSEDLCNKAKADCKRFFKEVESLLFDEADLGQVGHDFWLSRNGHGSGFFDGNYNGVEDELQSIAESYGCREFYVDEGVGHFDVN